MDVALSFTAFKTFGTWGIGNIVPNDLGQTCAFFSTINAASKIFRVFAAALEHSICKEVALLFWALYLRV